MDRMIDRSYRNWSSHAGFKTERCAEACAEGAERLPNKVRSRRKTPPKAPFFLIRRGSRNNNDQGKRQSRSRQFPFLNAASNHLSARAVDEEYFGVSCVQSLLRLRREPGADFLAIIERRTVALSVSTEMVDGRLAKARGVRRTIARRSSRFAASSSPWLSPIRLTVGARKKARRP